jgi:hypothetical protein
MGPLLSLLGYSVTVMRWYSKGRHVRYALGYIPAELMRASLQRGRHERHGTTDTTRLYQMDNGDATDAISAT